MKNRSRVRCATRALAALLPAALLADPAGAVDRSWFGGDGNWADAANWSPAGVPGSADKATLGAGSATLSASASVGSLFNDATINVQSGTLLPTGGTSAGLFNLGAGAVLEFRNGSSVLDQITTAGAGTLQISTDNVGADALVTINGGTLGARLLFSGSTINGSDHSFLAASAWTGGTFSGAARTSFLNDLSITGPNTKTLLAGRILDLHGTTTWSGNTGHNNNAIRFWNGGTLNNLGTFNDANDFDSFIEHSVGGPHNFNNVGTYNKLKATITTSDLGVAFNNSGTLNVQAGTFRPTGGTSTGAFNIAADAVLDFRNGNNTLDGATTAGAGTLMISSDNVGGDAVVAINGGTHTAKLLLSGSTLTGSDHVFQAAATWTGGAISGAARTSFMNDVSISGAATKSMIGGRIVDLHGTTNWSGNTGHNNNAIRFWNGATLNNLGTFNDANDFDSFIEHNVGGPHTFSNQGTYNKLRNTTTTFDLGVVLANTGTMNVQAGRLQVMSGMTNDGTVRVAAGAVFHGNAAAFVNAGVFTGDGTVSTHANGDVANIGHIRPGDGIGLLTIDGDLTQLAGGALDIELASLASFDRLAVTDDVTLTGTLLVVNAGYKPVLGDSFVVMTFDQRLGNSSFAALDKQGYGAGVNFEAIYNPHDVTLVVTSVPEPATWGLMLMGLMGVAARTRRLPHRARVRAG